MVEWVPGGSQVSGLRSPVFGRTTSLAQQLLVTVCVIGKYLSSRRWRVERGAGAGAAVWLRDHDPFRFAVD